jgi:hypothetical protein
MLKRNVEHGKASGIEGGTLRPNCGSIIVMLVASRLSSVRRLMVEGRVEWRRNGAPNAIAPGNGSVAGAKYAHIDGGQVAAVQPDAGHVQPFVAGLALHHGAAVVSAITNTARAVTRYAAAVSRGRSGAVGRRCDERVVKGVERDGVGLGHVGIGLSPALVVRFQCILDRAICMG